MLEMHDSASSSSSASKAHLLAAYHTALKTHLEATPKVAAASAPEKELVVESLDVGALDESASRIFRAMTDFYAQREARLFDELLFKYRHGSQTDALKFLQERIENTQKSPNEIKSSDERAWDLQHVAHLQRIEQLLARKVASDAEVCASMMEPVEEVTPVATLSPAAAQSVTNAVPTAKKTRLKVKKNTASDATPVPPNASSAGLQLLSDAEEESATTAAASSGDFADDSHPSATSTPFLRGRLSGFIPVAATPEELRDVYLLIVRKFVPRAARLMREGSAAKQAYLKKLASVLQRESRRARTKSFEPSQKDIVARCKRIAKEIASFWKRNEKDEKEARKRAEKDELERRKKDEEMRESNRQAKKLNFLITQTELYSHFVAKKTAAMSGTTAVTPTTPAASASIDFDATTDEALHEKARQTAAEAVHRMREKTKIFDASVAAGRQIAEEEASPSPLKTSPTSPDATAVTQPRLLTCRLKEYQLKGLGWLASLYEQGINGILADEMGLGKTVQSISLMAHLAEKHGIWGPFLVVTPASTLHNWQQEVTKFMPTLKVLPYWGSVSDRAMLRKYWNVKKLGVASAPFHVLVTSYQLIVSDEKHFKRLKWQYMILDEAQAIKSSSSQRWKTLLSINCRNRLLLTGTPIQNSMQELWALLHFIMPTLFDSHEEFSEWFSKEIESHAEQKSSLNETQLARLHMILKPFMLRRIKKDVENELAAKIEIEIPCSLTSLQIKMYEKIKGKTSIEEMLDRVINEFDSSDSASVVPFRSSSGGGHHGNGGFSVKDKTLMNLMMQLRKVCNHPELFDRVEVKTPFVFGAPNPDADGCVAVGGPLANPLDMLLPRSALRVRAKTQWAENHCLLHHESESVHSSLSVASPIVESIFDSVAAVKRSFHEAFCDEISVLFSSLPQLYFPKAIAQAPKCQVNDVNFVQHEKHQNFIVWNLPRTENILQTAKEAQEHVCIRRTPLSSIAFPDTQDLIAKSGKMLVLDKLLPTLKAEGHRVLIYFQMTKMIDIMEEYLTYKKYQYLRLDGSCKISDRRDMVADFQSKNDIFIFLLSTRAGGLGINLTAADTVIFYDSDWNPTVDQQAMDRAHRLGQTKQVTVYRLITKNTIEERIMQRAKQKGEIHKLVVAAGAENASSTAAAAAKVSDASDACASTAVSSS